MKNAKVIKEGLKEAGYSVSGGVNAPYIWLKTPNNMSSWDFFDYLLEKLMYLVHLVQVSVQAVKDTSD